MPTGAGRIVGAGWFPFRRALENKPVHTIGLARFSELKGDCIIFIDIEKQRHCTAADFHEEKIMMPLSPLPRTSNDVMLMD